MSVLRELMLKILLKKEVDVMAVVYATLIIYHQGQEDH